MERIIDKEIIINKTALKNRLVMPPMATHKSNEDGSVSDELISYYDEKTNGGYIGLVITEHSYVSLKGKASERQISVSRDDDVPGLEKLVRVIHKNGCVTFAQINHAGGSTDPSLTGYETVSASNVKPPRTRPILTVPHEMDKADIKQVIDEFTAAAVRVKNAGYDGVEIHSAHGYLLNQFYSPLTNKRTDEYSGHTLEGRIRLHLQIIEALRSALGKDYPIVLRLGACDYAEGGTVVNDSVKAASYFEEAGLDLLDVSGGFCGYLNPHSDEQGYFADITEEIKKHVSLPVIVTGGITDISFAEKLLEEKKADLIGVGRAIYHDSAWAKQAMDVRAKD